jgi:hypothetical protein
MRRLTIGARKVAKNRRTECADVGETCDARMRNKNADGAIWTPTARRDW